jgi:hypothetical protein
LVISPPISINGRSLRIESSALDPQELRFSLLFWDVLDFPTNNVIYMELDRNAQFLREAGILQRTACNGPSGDVAQSMRQAHVAAFHQLDAAEPGAWSLAVGSRSISFSDSELTEGRGVLVKLHRAIPVPDKDVPLEDILRFKRRRNSELLSLRHHLDTIYQHVSNAEDGRFALRSELDALDKAVADFIKSSRGARITWRLADLQANLNLVAGSVAAITAFKAGLGMVDVALAFGGAGIAVEQAAALVRKSTSATPFKYISAYHRELFPLS